MVRSKNLVTFWVQNDGTILGILFGHRPSRYAPSQQCPSCLHFIPQITASHLGRYGSRRLTERAVKQQSFARKPLWDYKLYVAS